MAVKMLSRTAKTNAKSNSSAAVRSAVRTKYSEYSAAAPTDHARKASELAKKIREFEANIDSDPRPVVRSRDAKTGLFK
ncbi:hypothetical protein CU103_24285 [Phyllobacterium sophorae]|uniref:Uncharacterized protein n=1 Tax=Phyllobacterium sophorae TaxID=1520277 RepID=A0A2P7B3N6_9HYPH|nr:hypothetical protein CU103_24285 [Phyllobacterium sophorae]